MDASEMVILNGIRGSVAMPTCEGARGTGVDDYIAVSAGLVENTSNVQTPPIFKIPTFWGSSAVNLKIFRPSSAVS